MATEDERYRHSTQYRLWSYTPRALQELRERTNELAKAQITPRLAADPLPDFLTSEEEQRLVKFFTIELIRAAQFCELPTEIRTTAVVFFRRFYVTNSVMMYPPPELLKTALFFGCKAEGFYIRLGKLAEKFPNTTGEQILAGEYLLCQGIRFAFDVRHPFRALEGTILELRRRYPEQEARISKAHAKAREILKFSPFITDVYFHYSPSQISIAALLIVDAELVDWLLSGFARADGDGADAKSRSQAEDQRDKIMSAIKACKSMLEEEPPERMAEYWGLPETGKAMRPLRRKLQKCRDPDRADLVGLQKARRMQASNKEGNAVNGSKPKTSIADDAAVFGGGDARDTKRRKLEQGDDMFGPPL